MNQTVARGREVRSAIAEARPERVIVRGSDLCDDLIGSVGFTEYFLFLLTGNHPSAGLVRLVDASLVAIAEHGVVPSVVAARATYAASPEAMHGAVAAGLLGCGSVILGAAETAGEFLTAILDQAGKDGNLDVAAVECVRAVRTAGALLPGFGHPLHKPVDPRAARLMALSREEGLAARHVAALQAVSRALPIVYGKPLTLNVSGAMAAVLLDAGFPQKALKGIPLIARSASLVAHLLEEQARPIGIKLADSAAAIVVYDGPPPKEPHAAYTAKDGTLD